MNFENNLMQSLYKMQTEIANICNQLSGVSPPTAQALIQFSTTFTNTLATALQDQLSTKVTHCMSLLDLNTETRFTVSESILAYLKYHSIKKINIPIDDAAWVVGEDHVYLEKNNTRGIPDFTYRIVFEFSSWHSGLSFNSAHFNIKLPLLPDRYRHPLTVSSPEENHYYNKVLADVVGMPEKYLTSTFVDTLAETLETIDAKYRDVPAAFEIVSKGNHTDGCVVDPQLSRVFENLLNTEVSHLGSYSYRMGLLCSYDKPTLFAVGNQKIVAIPYGFRSGTIDQHFFVALNVNGKPKVLPVKDYFTEEGFRSNFTVFVLIDILDRLTKI